VELAGRSASQLEKLSIGDVCGRRGDRELVRAARVEVAVEKIGADVVALRQLHPRSV